jgi:hypothetical protein
MSRVLVLAAALALSGCASSPGRGDRTGIDEGYLLGAADTVKQLYWAKQALEAPEMSKPAGSIEYYTWEESGVARDGRRLAPETVAVPVFIPAPAPSGSREPCAERHMPRHGRWPGFSSSAARPEPEPSSASPTPRSSP